MLELHHRIDFRHSVMLERVCMLSPKTQCRKPEIARKSQDMALWIASQD